MTSALVIDDNRQAALSLCQMLTMLGLHASPAYSPRSAFQLLALEAPDIIFVDINMPGVTGFEVLSFVQRDPRLAKVPVVVVTSDDQAETAQRVRQEGAFDLVIKPATMEGVERILKAARVLD